MSRKMLIGVIAAAVVGVGTIAAVTAAVIVDDQSGGELVVHRSPVPVPREGLPPLGRGRGGQLFPFDRGAVPQLGPFRGLRACLRKYGLVRPDRGAPLEPKKLRDAFRACADALPDRFRAPRPSPLPSP